MPKINDIMIMMVWLHNKEVIQDILIKKYSTEETYHKTSNISCNLAGNKMVDHSDVVAAAPTDAAPITSSFST